MFGRKLRMAPRTRMRVCHPGIFCEQLEERIVLDAAAGVSTDQHKTDGTQNQDSHQPTTPDTAQTQQVTSQPAAAATAAAVPDSLAKVFAHDLNVILVSNALDKIQSIEAAADRDAHVLAVDAAQDSLKTVTQMIENLVESTGQKVGTLAVLSHGNAGLLTIGHDEITPFNIGLYQNEFVQLSTLLTKDAQIQFYGCAIAGSVLGQSLTAGIAYTTAAEVFASTDTTGVQGNWSLEYASDPNVAMKSLFVTERLAALDVELAAPYPVHENNWGMALSGAMYYVADDGVHGKELWRSDGTAAGTYMVADINPGSADSNPTEMTVFNGVLYFSASDGTGAGHHETELWRSDGTAAGTYLVVDLNVNPNQGSNPHGFTVFSGALYFAATDGNSAGEHGVELYKTDGTAAGTNMVADINPGQGSSNPAWLTPVGGNLFFAASDGNTAADHGVELWKTDGTAAGTQMVVDINPGNQDGNPSHLTNVNGTLFFSATDGTSAANHGVELWKSDGTAGGTSLVADINPGNQDSNPSELTDVNGVLFFAASDGNGATGHGTELWISDGTSGGTLLAKDINPGKNSSDPSGLLNVNGTVYFAADDGTHGSELWRSDGSDAGTYLVQDIYPGAQASGPTFLNNYNGNLLFAADDGTHGYELWHSDGTTAGTYLFKDINPTGSSFPLNFARLNPLFFLADDGTGFKLWKSDGTVEGTVKVSDVVPQGSNNGSSGITPTAGAGTPATTQDGLGAGTLAGNPGEPKQAGAIDSFQSKWHEDAAGRSGTFADYGPLLTGPGGFDLSQAEQQSVPAKTPYLTRDHEGVPKQSGRSWSDATRLDASQSGSSSEHESMVAKADSGIPGMIKVVILDDGDYSIRAEAIAFVIGKDLWMPRMVKWYLTAVSEGRYRPGSLPRGYERMVWDFLSNSFNGRDENHKTPNELELKLAWQWAEWRRQVSKDRGNADVLPWSYFRGLSQAMILFYGQAHGGKVDYSDALNTLHQNVRNLTIIPVRLPEELMSQASPDNAIK